VIAQSLIWHVVPSREAMSVKLLLEPHFPALESPTSFARIRKMFRSCFDPMFSNPRFA
jgi:hypothetical protein